MRSIRPITEHEIDHYMAIFSDAYPGIDISGAVKQQHFYNRLRGLIGESDVSLYALFEDGRVRGIMRLYDFTMNLLSRRVLVGGLGGLAVGLLDKKERVAADMVQFFLDHYRQKGACLTALYPFRPDFYRRMGFGYGTKRNLYRVRPTTLPKGPGRTPLTFLTEKNREAVEACYLRFVDRHHGLMDRPGYRWSELFARSKVKVVGTWRERRLSGYLAFQFEKGRHGHFLSNDLLVHELVYDSAQDLQELMRFLHIQADQIDRIIFYTQDEFFHFLMRDPRNDSNNLLPQVYHETNTQGVGIMYRVIDVNRFFTLLQEHNFAGVTCRLKIHLEDSFYPENAGSYFVHFEEGHASLGHEGVSDVEIKLDVADFSSLVMGAVKLEALHAYGLVNVSDEQFVHKLDQLFAAPKPICFTEF